MTEILSLDAEDRFARFRLISWWDQERLKNAKALVIGAGALGNEILKNLALLGVGRVWVADLDRIENSNLSRSVLFREGDTGRSKAEVAAERAAEIYPEQRIETFQGNIVFDLGLGIYRWADVIIAGLDNREARVAINRAAARVGKPWIDGAIERLDGVARVFDAATGPCYECTMNAVDWKMLEARRSCALLTREELEAGKTPTTPTTASVIAGIECQEAVKMLHGLETLAGRAFVFEGLMHQSYTTSYTRKPDCFSHEPYEPLTVLDESARTLRAGDLLARAKDDLGADAVIDLNHDLLAGLECPACQVTEPRFASLGKVTEREGKCPRCGAMRAPITYHSITGDESFLDRSLFDLGVPLWDIIGARGGDREMYYELGGDRGEVLGRVADDSLLTNDQ